MSEERMSKLQRVIMKTIQEWKHPDTGKPMGHLPYRHVCRGTAEEMGRAVNPMLVMVGGFPNVGSGFRATFSQSARNLESKGFAWLEYHGGVQEDTYGQKVARIHLTAKYKSLNLNKDVKNKKKSEVMI